MQSRFLARARAKFAASNLHHTFVRLCALARFDCGRCGCKCGCRLTDTRLAFGGINHSASTRAAIQAAARQRSRSLLLRGVIIIIRIDALAARCARPVAKLAAVLCSSRRCCCCCNAKQAQMRKSTRGLLISIHAARPRRKSIKCAGHFIAATVMSYCAAAAVARSHATKLDSRERRPTTDCQSSAALVAALIARARSHLLRRATLANVKCVCVCVYARCASAPVTSWEQRLPLACVTCARLFARARELCATAAASC